MTVEVGGATGIPTSGTFSEFQITIDEIYNDETIQSKGLADHIEAEDLPRERHMDGKGSKQCHRCGSFNDFKKMKFNLEEKSRYKSGFL